MSATAWTERRIEELKRLWAAGLSASQCACELHDGEFKGLPILSRNAVIGKVHRLGLAGRAKNQPSKAAPRPRKVRMAPVPAIHQRILSIKQAREEAAEERAVEIAEESVLPTAQSVSLLELTDALCHWPIGDPQKPDFHFCGGKAMPALPYCAHHARIAYQPATARRISNADISDAERARRAKLSTLATERAKRKAGFA